MENPSRPLFAFTLPEIRQVAAAAPPNRTPAAATQAFRAIMRAT
jgi:hypothetical protein